MLRSVLVRVGFVTHLLWDRYGPFWTALARSVEAEAVVAEPDAVLDRLTDPRVAAATGVVFRLAVAAALALDDVDLLVVPRLNPDRDGAPGGGQDPWIADLPAALERARGPGPAIWPVASDLGAALENEAVPFLARLVHDPARVRRAWSQHRAEARPPRRAGGGPLRRPSDGRTVAVVGQPWLATPALARLTARADEQVVGPWTVDPAELREEGRRVDARWIDSDAEALGAVRRFARTASVDVVRLVVDGTSGSDAWLARRAEALAPRRLEVVDLRDVGEPEARVRALLAP